MATIYNPARGGFVAVHGHSGGGRTPTYHSWQNMHARCRYPSVPSYPNYGGRGITVCERWADFANFLADMGERPPGTQISRTDNDGNYEPGNCAWESREKNLAERNRRAPSRGNPANLIPGTGRGRTCPTGCACNRHNSRIKVRG